MSEKATRLAYGEALVELGAQNDKVVVLDADLAHATMTHLFMSAYPQRFFNAGIAEADMVGMAAVAVAIALIIWELRSEQAAAAPQVAAASDDEWED